MFRQRQIEMLKYILWLECFKRAPSTRRMCLPKRLSRVHCIWRDGKKSQFIYHESNNFFDFAVAIDSLVQRAQRSALPLGICFV